MYGVGGGGGGERPFFTPDRKQFVIHGRKQVLRMYSTQVKLLTNPPIFQKKKKKINRNHTC